MDTTIITVFSQMSRTKGCSADDILETPELRVEYLQETRQLLGDLPEQQLLHRLTNLRKAGRLPKSRELKTSASSAA
jgi:hypothetical protein